jgi:sporulation-control protein spo0M
MSMFGECIRRISKMRGGNGTQNVDGGGGFSLPLACCYIAAIIDAERQNGNKFTFKTVLASLFGEAPCFA